MQAHQQGHDAGDDGRGVTCAGLSPHSTAGHCPDDPVTRCKNTASTVLLPPVAEVERVSCGVHRPDRQNCGQGSGDVETVAPLIPGCRYDQHARPIAVADGIGQDRVGCTCRGELTPADVDDVCPG